MSERSTDGRSPARVLRRAFCGVALLGCAALWTVVLAPRWTQRITPGWRWEAHFVGVQTWPDPETRALPARDTVALYDRSMKVTREDERPRAVHVADRHVARDAATGNAVWSRVSETVVDPRTGAALGVGTGTQQFLFPREVERRTYVLRNGRLKGLPVDYEGEDEIDGLVTYLFRYQGPSEYSEAYTGGDDVEGIRPGPREEIRCADDQYEYRVWVEPLTGEAIRMEESCYAGDYIFDRISGVRVAPVDRFASVMASNAVLQRVDAARWDRLRYLAASRGVPCGLAGLGCVFLVAAGLAAWRTSKGDDRHAA